MRALPGEERRSAWALLEGECGSVWALPEEERGST